MNTLFMKQPFAVRKFMALSLVASIGFLHAACQKETAAVEPVPSSGTLLITANPQFLSVDEGTKLDVYLDDKKVGTLTRGFVGFGNKTAPDCDAKTSASVLRVEAEAGTYTLKGEVMQGTRRIMYYAPQQVTVAASQCQHLISAPIKITL
ncbi:hypothetical protein GCM10027341_08450 [Spirosoma knui]